MRPTNDYGTAVLIRRLEALIMRQRTEIQQLQKIVARRTALGQTVTRG